MGLLDVLEKLFQIGGDRGGTLVRDRDLRPSPPVDRDLRVASHDLQLAGRRPLGDHVNDTSFLGNARKPTGCTRSPEGHVSVERAVMPREREPESMAA